MRSPPSRAFRVLALVPDAFGGRGGIALYNRHFLSALGNLPRCARIVAIPRNIVDSPGPVPERIDFRISGSGGKWNYVTAVLRSLFERAGYDVVVCAHLNLLPLAFACARLKRAKLLLLVYGVEAWQKNRNWLVNSLVQKVDQVISISDTTSSRFAAWSGIEGSRIGLLPNAIQMDLYGAGPKSAELVERYRLTGKTVLMTMGRLVGAERQKGFDEVLEALPGILRFSSNVVYLIVGDGPDKERLRRKAAALALEETVIFTGWIPESEKADHFRLADLYVMPSRGEGFGFVLIEAMACGVPVVASRADGGREALLGGKLGELVEPGDADQLLGAVLKGLQRPRGVVPAGLAYFSRANFDKRAKALLENLLDAVPAGSAGVQS